MRAWLKGSAAAIAIAALTGCGEAETDASQINEASSQTAPAGQTERTDAADTSAGAAPATTAEARETTDAQAAATDSGEIGAAEQAAVYQTYGVHNEGTAPPCDNADCTYPRGPGEPENPVWPEHWVSGWTMYRVFNKWADNPPPYPGRPPADLTEGTDYEVSYGRTYYDSNWTGDSGEGAMMEHYEDKCLPIFPFDNSYSCSFISLGNTAFFVTYDDRPDWMPPVCLFSKFNHPPRRDFIKHLPYDAADSARIGPDGQGYSFWVSHADGRVIQTGAAPDRTADAGILFGYGFDAVDGEVMPQSFYFSGVPYLVENGQPTPFAPIVSQNYTDFQVVQPDPAETWDLVNALDPDTLPLCQLFDPPSHATAMLGDAEPAPTWGTIGRGGR
ncbi:MAG: hypothetical protein RKE49_10085 [Oceanicaulis sp.]